MSERCINTKYGDFLFKYNSSNEICIYLEDNLIGTIDYKDISVLSDLELLSLTNEIDNY